MVVDDGEQSVLQTPRPVTGRSHAHTPEPQSESPRQYSRQLKLPSTEVQYVPRPQLESLVHEAPCWPEPTMLEQTPLEPLRTQRSVDAQGTWVTTSQVCVPQVLLLRQVWVLPQVPHEPPQPSLPHVLPAQLGVQQAPAEVQVAGATQLPQLALREAPQLSAAVAFPHVRPRRVQKAVFVSGVQHAPTLALQVCGAVQAPQLATERAAPQLSAAVAAPHVLPSRAQNAVSVSGAQQLPALQLDPAAQVPHEAIVRGRPQLSVVCSPAQLRALAL